MLRERDRNKEQEKRKADSRLSDLVDQDERIRRNGASRETNRSQQQASQNILNSTNIVRCTRSSSKSV